MKNKKRERSRDKEIGDKVQEKGGGGKRNSLRLLTY